MSGQLDFGLDVPVANSLRIGSEETRTVANAAEEFIRSVQDRRIDQFLISCSKAKLSTEKEARELYCSSLFRTSAGLAERLGVRYRILSAKYGLLDPGQRIKPYDVKLSELPKSDQSKWANSVVSKLAADEKPLKAAVLAGSSYSSAFLPYLANDAYISLPLKSRSLGQRLAFLKQCHRLLDRSEAIARIYDRFQCLVTEGSIPTLKEAMEQRMPERGVYFFFDDNEPTNFSKRLPRVVRIGTHGVSIGSKATLRNRLRTHLGTKQGLGNHRSSVFRLHIGDAIINRDGLRRVFPQWGKGGAASADIILQERNLEALVSDYISKLRVLWVEINDLPSSESQRAAVERNTIALFTESLVFPDKPSAGWLGLRSSQRLIVCSGLWNMRAVGQKCELRHSAAIDGSASQSVVARKQKPKEVLDLFDNASIA